MRTIVTSFLSLLFILISVHARSQQVPSREAWVDSVFHSLSMEERIAQLMIVRANDPGKDYSRNIEKYIREYNIGGLCFFRNHPYHQAQTTNRWQELSRTPLLISIDAEWGLGMRLDSTVVFPFQMGLGAIADDSLIYQMGERIARDCRRIGVHMNFAPVVDVNSNPANPVIGMRSFGQDKHNVTLKGLAYMRGLQDHGVIATAKHFPGHGDTDTDSHKTLPVIGHDRPRLDSLELYPFRQMIRQGLGGIMIAHLFIPAFEGEEGLASTLSFSIVNELLRKELGFEGLIVTDALDMKGVTKNNKAGEIELLALLAGNDILLLPSDPDKAIERISRALDDGEIAPEVINKRCRKVLEYKYDAGLADYQAVELKGLHNDLNSSAARALNLELYEASATLVRNEHGILPIQRPDTLVMAYVSLGGAEGEDHFRNTLELYGKVDAYELPGRIRKKDAGQIMEELDQYNLVILGIRNTNIYAFKDFGISDDTWEFVKEICRQKKVVLDLFASPYALGKLAGGNLPEAIIVSYQDNPVTQCTGAQLIFGGIGASGSLPVDAGGMFEAGKGITTEAIRLHLSDPAVLGIPDSFIARADSIALSGIEMKAYPGCQVIAACNGNIFYNKVFGHHTYERKRAVEPGDIYDLASLTKIAASCLSLMDLYGRGMIDIDRRLSHYLPYLKQSDKKSIIIRELMAHQSRFQAWIPYFKYTLGQEGPLPSPYQDEISEDYPVRVAEGMYIQRDYVHAILDSIRFSSLCENNHYRYSDLGFYLLKEAMEMITNAPYKTYTARHYYDPMGLPTMGYLPLEEFPRERIVPTEDDKIFRKQVLQGDVHDQGAAMIGGVSGHAGLFSNAFDMAAIMQMFLDGGVYGGKRYVEEDILKEFTRTQFPLNLNRRGIGFDKPMFEYDEDGPACRSASPQSFGHSGFTGTYAWADPETGLVYVFLSNRIHPDASNAKIMEYDIRTNLHQVFYDAMKYIDQR